MIDDLTVGFVGFGEAGSHIARGLKAAGCSQVVAFDIAPDKVRHRPLKRECRWSPPIANWPIRHESSFPP
jgi:3-hydroxyisobutyrate dehydrogenase-like beta-hydroxyacid dehydrogenase